MSWLFDAEKGNMANFQMSMISLQQLNRSDFIIVSANLMSESYFQLAPKMLLFHMQYENIRS
jgi:hypothetical protein